MTSVVRPKKRLLIIVALVIFVLVNSLVTAWALYSRFEQTNRNRQSNAEVWHAVICQIEASVLASPRATAAEKREALLFYDKLLVENVHTDPCGLVTGR